MSTKPLETIRGCKVVYGMQPWMFNAVVKSGKKHSVDENCFLYLALRTLAPASVPGPVYSHRAIV